MMSYNYPSLPMGSFQLRLYATGDIVMRYVRLTAIVPSASYGLSASVGMINLAHDTYTQISYHQQDVLRPTTSEPQFLLKRNSASSYTVSAWTTSSMPAAPIASAASLLQPTTLPLPPSATQNITVNSTATTVTLTWTPHPGGATPNFYSIAMSTAADFSSG